MGQDMLTYTFVARKTTVLAEYTAVSGNFPAVAVQCLQRLPASNKKFVYRYDNHSYNYLLHNDYSYCVVAKESVSERLCIAFLERVKTDFVKICEGGNANTYAAKSLTKTFGPIMKEQMQYVIDHANEIDKVSKLKDEVSQVQNIMQENIFKVIDRGENITTLVDKTQDLQNSAEEFKERGVEIRRKMWYKNMKVKLIVIGILIMLALIIWLSICHGFNCSN